MARSSRSQSQNSSLAGKASTLDSISGLSDPIAEAATEPPNQHNHQSTTGGDLEDGEISEDANSPVYLPVSTENAPVPVTAPAMIESLRGTDAIPILILDDDEPSHDNTYSPSSPQGSISMPLPEPIDMGTGVEYGRALSAEELDRAKSLVLDLLGWGVEPEYLVECGVSAPVLYRIFTDLNLRLPSNLVYFG